MLGCGNSLLSEEMYDDGFNNITNIDISPIVISQMQERSIQSRPSMNFLTGDVTDMHQLETNSFDSLIDKSTIDALLCGDNSFTMTAKMLKEVTRILKIGGVYFVISYGNPNARTIHLTQ